MVFSHYINICLFFCTLSAVVACQKIDMSDFTEEEQEKAIANKEKEDKELENAEEEDADKSTIQLQTLDDGTLLFPSDSHVVASETRLTDGRRIVMYISLYEWSKMYSAFNVEATGTAADIAAKYKEGDITGWHIPTKEEAKALRDQYNRSDDAESETSDTPLSKLNEQILNAGGKTLRVVDRKDAKKAYRFLCDNAQYTFSLKTNSKTTKAGKTTLYHLRLVKDSVLSE